jgi:hypothetical protein
LVAWRVLSKERIESLRLSFIPEPFAFIMFGAHEYTKR